MNVSLKAFYQPPFTQEAFYFLSICWVETQKATLNPSEGLLAPLKSAKSSFPSPMASPWHSREWSWRVLVQPHRPLHHLGSSTTQFSQYLSPGCHLLFPCFEGIWLPPSVPIFSHFFIPINIHIVQREKPHINSATIAFSLLMESRTQEVCQSLH